MMNTIVFSTCSIDTDCTLQRNRVRPAQLQWNATAGFGITTMRMTSIGSLGPRESPTFGGRGFAPSGLP
jgi:hypothetical protein